MTDPKDAEKEVEDKSNGGRRGGGADFGEMVEVMMMMSRRVLDVDS